MKGLLLDTHVWIWLMEGIPLLGSKYRKIINEAVLQTQVNISAISLWEVSMLVMKSRIKLEKPISAWIEESLSLPGMALKPLTPHIAIEACQLPEGFHGDPADRLIVATARLHNLVLLTHDSKIIEYANKEYLSVIAV